MRRWVWRGSADCRGTKETDVSKEQIRVDMSTVHSTGGYHVHSAHVNRSEIEVVVLDVLRGCITHGRGGVDVRGVVHTDDSDVRPGRPGANRPRDIPDDAPDPKAVREYVQAAADTIPAEPVREIVDKVIYWADEMHRLVHIHGLPRELTDGFDSLVAWIADLDGAVAPSGQSPAPHGTVAAHLAEQMKDPEFRAEYEAEGESELRKAAKIVVATLHCGEAATTRYKQEEHMDLKGACRNLAAVLESDSTGG